MGAKIPGDIIKYDYPSLSREREREREIGWRNEDKERNSDRGRVERGEKIEERGSSK